MSIYLSLSEVQQYTKELVMFLDVHFGEAWQVNIYFSLMFQLKLAASHVSSIIILSSCLKDCLSTFHLATFEGALCCYVIIQLYHRPEVVLGVVDVLFFGC
jgi:hypothetical protein